MTLMTGFNRLVASSRIRPYPKYRPARGRSWGLAVREA